MRVLRRDPDREPDNGDAVVADEDSTPGPDATVDERPRERRSFFRRHDDREHDRDGDGRDDRTEPVPATTSTTRESEVVTEQWSFADAVVALIGAGLALVGALVLVRTGIDASWYRPVETVADADHTPLLGALEVGAGVLLMLAAASRSRALPALTGLAIAVAGGLAAIENAEVSRELAIEESWAWMLAGVGLVVTIVSLAPPRRRRVERLVES
jgi:hypothetical protein